MELTKGRIFTIEFDHENEFSNVINEFYNIVETI